MIYPNISILLLIKHIILITSHFSTILRKHDLLMICRLIYSIDIDGKFLRWNNGISKFLNGTQQMKFVFNF